MELKELQSAVDALNVQIRLAADAGIYVEVSTICSQTLGDKHERPIVLVRLKKEEPYVP